MFPGDLKVQGRRLMSGLATVVAGLDRPDQLLPTVKALGARHAGWFGEYHYQIVGEALVETLEQCLGSTFTSAVREAWTSTFDMLTEAVVSAAPRQLAAA